MCFLNPLSNFIADFSQKLFHLRALEISQRDMFFSFPYWYRKNCLTGKIVHLFQICLFFDASNLSALFFADANLNLMFVDILFDVLFYHSCGAGSDGSVITVIGLLDLDP
jgi:hypothetical protein